MPDISKVTLPDNTTYDLIGKIGRGILRAETDDSSTATAFIVNIPGITELYEGLTISIKNTVIASASGCTINVNGLGAKSIWRSLNNALLTSQWAINTEYLFVYDDTNDRWVIQQGYDTDTNTKPYFLDKQYSGIKTGALGTFAKTLVMQLPDGTWESIVTSASTATTKEPNTHGFLLNDILYCTKDTAANTVIGTDGLYQQETSRLDMTYTLNVANNATYGLTATKPVYIVGTIGNDGLFYLSNPWWSQTLPNTEDGKVYIYIGSAHDRYRMPFVLNHPMYRYINGMVREYSQDADTVDGHTVAKDVPSNAEFTDTQSDWNATSGKAVILNKPTIPTVNNGTLTIQKNGTQVATFTANQSGNSTANITVPTVTDTYSSTGTDATSGKAVAAALGTLDGTVSGTAGVSKTLTAFSQTDGKVSATFGNISITKSQVSDFPSLGTAAAKNYTTSVTSGSSDLVTSGAVYTAIDNLPEPMVFKGSLGTDGTITALPVDGTATIGDTYKVITAGTYASKSAKVGDTFICLTKTSSANTWELIPSGDEPSGTVTSVTIKATSPIAIDSSSAITTSGTRTLSHANSGVTAGTYNSVTVNATGHVTAGSSITATGSGTTGISIADHSTGSITGVQASTTTASKVTLGTAISVPNVTGATDVTVPTAASSATTVPIKNTSATSIPNVTSVGSASNWVFENITVPKAASSATSIPNVTAVGSGSFTSGSFSGGSGSFTATVTNGVLSFSHTHTAATHGADSHTHTAPTLGTAISVTGVSGSTTASHVKSGGNGTAPTLGTAISIIGVQSTTTSVTGVSGSTTASKVTLGTAISVPNVTAATDVTVPIKNTSATTVVTSKTHTVTDNGHTHTLS